MGVTWGSWNAPPWIMPNPTTSWDGINRMLRFSTEEFRVHGKRRVVASVTSRGRIKVCSRCRTGVEGGGDCACGWQAELAAAEERLRAKRAAEAEREVVAALARERARHAPSAVVEHILSSKPRRYLTSRVAAPWWALARVLSLQWVGDPDGR